MEGVALGVFPSRREVVQTTASLTGWGAVWKRRVIRGNWSFDQALRDINILEFESGKVSSGALWTGVA